MVKAENNNVNVVEIGEKNNNSEKLICKNCKSHNMHVQLVSNVENCNPYGGFILLIILVLIAAFLYLIVPRIAIAIFWMVGIMIASWFIRRISIKTNIEKYAICDECGYSYKIVN